MSAATLIGKKTIRMVNGIVDTAVLIAILLLIVTGFYAIWDSRQVYKAAGAARYEIYKPTAENQGKTFAELQAINPDVFAWLTVYGTHIDYPVVQGTNNMKYINTNAEGQYSLSGAIFLDMKSSKDFTDFSSILYGHHMEKQTMFGEIGTFVQHVYFDEHKHGMLYFNGREHGLEFFAFVHANAYDKAVFRVAIEGREAQQEYLDMLLDMAQHTRDLGVTIDDRIVLLTTCSAATTNGRDILVGRITDELFGDAYKTEAPAVKEKEILSVDALLGLWEQTPYWARIVIIVLPAVILLLSGTMIINKKRYLSLTVHRPDCTKKSIMKP